MPAPGVTRTLILKAACDVLAKEGLAAVTTRRVAREADVNQALVHYHFTSIEQLLLEVLLYSKESVATSLSDIFDGEGDLVSQWATYAHRGAGSDYPQYVPSLWLQTISLAATDPTLAETYKASYLEPVHDVIFRSAAATFGASPQGDTRAEALTALIMAVQRSVLIDRLLGSSRGHEELFSLVEELLRSLVPEQGAEPSPSTA